MEIRYLHDADTELPHFRRHGVSEREVDEVLRSPGEDLPARGGARMKIGTTAAGRCMAVVYVADETPDGVFVMTAYELQGKAKRAFHRRQRRRGRS